MTNLFDDSAGRDAEVHSMRVLILIIYRSDLFTDVRGCSHIMSAAGGGGGGKPKDDDC